eukprot:NODE_31607_length_393_cov_0.928571.p2 GENE.NODE_31607_length_393_cov_0.928571~~NODE_31607_length_393_cov_0.928571.p2  ORF type:complete len:51 (-),score=10.12 NODE_31607_length_393_cov_0.928571:60-212(-)
MASLRSFFYLRPALRLVLKKKKKLSLINISDPPKPYKNSYAFSCLKKKKL